MGIDRWHISKAGLSWRMMLITVPWVLGIILAITSSRHDKQVAIRVQQTGGLITSHEIGNHNQYRYTFSVADKGFNGLSQSPSDTIAVGAYKTVFFDPLDPTSNSLYDFGAGQSILGLVTFAGMGIILMVCIILASKKKLRSEHTQTSYRV